MIQERIESARVNHGTFVNTFHLEVKKILRKIEKMKKRIIKQGISVVFNNVCLNEGMLPKYTNIYIYPPSNYFPS